MTQSLEQKTVKKIFLRLMPLLLISYLMAYIDRINVGFAALTMNKEIGLSASVFGLGAGLFFWGYFLCEVPSNLIMQRVGARRWIFRIMLTWGLLSAAMAFVAGPTSFLVMRLFLGVAEAGFFPGVILYMTYWFPGSYRARIIAAFSVSLPASLALGAPISSAVLAMDGLLNLSGWQWLFIVEGLPTVAIGFLILKFLPDRPVDAAWLSTEEKSWLRETLEGEEAAVAHHGVMPLWQMFFDRRVLLLCAIYFANTTINLGLAFFLPQIIKSMGLSNFQSGLYTSIPYIVGTVGILVWGYMSDRLDERRISLSLALVLAAVGLGGAALFIKSPTLAVAFLSMGAVGIYGAKAPFWTLPPMFLTGTAVAGGIAFINSVGNLGGFMGPSIVGWVRETTGSFEGGLFALSAFALGAAVLALFVVPSPTPVEITGRVEEAV